MPLPLIPLIIGGVSLIAGAVGAKKGYDGVQDLNEANKKAKEAEEKFKKKQQELEKSRQQTQKQAQNYGNFILITKRNVIQQFILFLQAINNKGEQEKYTHLLQEIGITNIQLQEYQADVTSAVEILGAVGSSVGAGAAASFGTLGMVGLLGTASTGTSIAVLGGAAAKSATLAWLGGGSLAAGGFGMAGGTAVLGGIAIAPAILIGGFFLASKGEKAKTKAEEFCAEVDVEISKMTSVESFLSSLSQRISELHYLVEKMSKRAMNSLSQLEPTTFSLENQTHISLFQQTASLVQALSDVTKTSILNESGSLSVESVQIQTKYAHFAI